MAAPLENTNAEKWTLESATELFERCLAVAKDKTSDSNDFIGEVAQECGTTLSSLDYIKTKFPALQSIYNQIKSNCESNCFRNGKNHKINASLAIMNLKSNHGWTDRVQTENTNVNHNIEVTKEDLKKLGDELDGEY